MHGKTLFIGLILTAACLEAASIRLQTTARWNDAYDIFDSDSVGLPPGVTSHTSSQSLSPYGLITATARAEGRKVGASAHAPAMPGPIPAELTPVEVPWAPGWTAPSTSFGEARALINDTLFIPGPVGMRVFLMVKAKVDGSVQDPSGTGIASARYILETTAGWSGGPEPNVDWQTGKGSRGYSEVFNPWLPAVTGQAFDLQILLRAFATPMGVAGGSLAHGAAFNNTAELEILGIWSEVEGEVGEEIIGALEGLQSELGIDYTPEDNGGIPGDVPEPAVVWTVGCGLGLLALRGRLSRR